MTRPKPLILMIDDDADIRRSLSRELALAGYDTLTAADGVAGREMFEHHRPDLVITDIAMPRADGFAVISAVRRSDRTPVLVLSVRGDEEDKIRALDLGADDYVIKPFYLRELLARVRTQLRRAVPAGMALPEILHFPDLVIDRGRRSVIQGGRKARLTPTELAILELLASHVGRPVTLRQIIATVWTGGTATTDTVRVHVGSLRRKLEPDPANPRYIGTEPWVGYRLLCEPIRQ